MKSTLTSIAASEPGAGSPDHVPGGEYLSDGGHQAVLDAMGMSIGMSL